MSRILCDVAGLGKVMKAKKGTWLDQRKIKHELSRKPLSAHQQRQLAHTAAGESTCSKDGICQTCQAEHNIATCYTHHACAWNSLTVGWVEVGRYLLIPVQVFKHVCLLVKPDILRSSTS